MLVTSFIGSWIGITATKGFLPFAATLVFVVYLALHRWQISLFSPWMAALSFFGIIYGMGIDPDFIGLSLGVILVVTSIALLVLTYQRGVEYWIVEKEDNNSSGILMLRTIVTNEKVVAILVELLPLLWILTGFALLSFDYRY